MTSESPGISEKQLIDLLKNLSSAGYLKAVIIDSAGNIISDISLSALRDALKGADNKDFSTLEADVEGIKAQTDKLQFDDLLALFTNRLDSLASLRKSLTIPEGSLYQVPEDQKVIVKDYVLAEGDLYVEGELLVV